MIPAHDRLWAIIPCQAALIGQWLDGTAKPLARVLDKLTPGEPEAFQGHGSARRRAARPGHPS